ncbi:MAG TPA: DUF4214 domain-containing protein [Acidimicrobiales bacterium]|nr:DUF4214 domain-containing protein [Acidimicrobiales bacterium]
MTVLGAMAPAPAAPAPGPPPPRAAAASPLNCTAWRYGPADEPASLPAEYDRDDYRRTSRRDTRPALHGSPQNHCGQKGAAVDLAWGRSTGSPEVLIAVLDSGIKWRDAGAMRDLATKTHVNVGEAAPPCVGTKPDGDCDGDGVFTIADFGTVTDRNGNGLADPQDLILAPAFSDGVDDDGDGYVDNISGWDFLHGDNDPFDTVSYGHGTGEALDSTAAANGTGTVGSCPRCMHLPVRVSDSFIADGGRFAAGVLYALDEGADVIQEALGALNNPRQAQDAIDAAYARGVVVVASMADEAGTHPNLPGSLERTMAVNSVTEKTVDLLGPAPVDGYLALNGCTNYGGRTFVSVPSDGCSSEATGQSAGMVGLVESHARELGLTPHPSLAGLGGPQAGDVLTANEVMQLVRASADDIDFSTPNAVDPANNFGTPTGNPLIDTVRYPTRPGWDAIHGYGRINAYELLRAVEAEAIPPEAMIDGPHWFDLLPTSGSVAVTGTVSAERATSYDYRVEWAPGVQGPAHPGTDTWTTVAEEEGLTTARSGTLATLDLAAVAAALPGDGTGPPVDPNDRDRPDEERFSVRLRVVVTAHGGPGDGLEGEMQKQVFVHHDPDLVEGYPARIEGAGAPSPSFTDVDGDGTTELVLGTDDGDVHAWRPDGTELAGFPLRTAPSPWWPSGSATAAADDVVPLRGGLMLGGPAIADLDGDDDNELVVADLNGRVQVFSATGAPGPAMNVDPAYSRDLRTAQDRHNRTKRGFLSAPSLGDLDGDGDLEIVAAALDRHVYAWHHDGTPVAGFPVLVVDPAKVAAVDATTHRVTFTAGSGVEDGGELLATPALADLDGDGRPEIVVGGQEQYAEDPNIGDGPGAVALLAAAGRAGNSRVYVISPDGAGAHASPPSATHPHAQAYLPGWPAKVAMAATNLLPTIGNGVAMPAVVGDVDPTTAGPEVVVASSAGPVYAFDRKGDGVYGTGDGGRDIPLFWSAGLGGEDAGTFGPDRNSDDLIASFAGFGGPVVGDLAGGEALEVTAPTAGLSRLIDLLVADRQLPSDDQLSMWDGASRRPLQGSPQATADLAFFVAPAVADLDGDGRRESIAGNSAFTLSAFDAAGTAPAGWPKLTGGWTVGTPAVGDWDGDGALEVAQPRRDGVLLVWTTGAGTAAEGAVSWSQWGCDATHAGSCVEAERSADVRYVEVLYQLALGRPADGPGRDYWAARLAGGTPRGRAVTSLLATPEGRRRLCRQAYSTTLGRAGDPAGLTWCASYLARGHDVTDVRTVLAGSDEMWDRAGGTVDGFLDALYQAALGRAVDSGARTHWRGRLAAGTSRASVARAVLTSDEARGRLVDGYYRQVFGRGVDGPGRTYWVRWLAGHRDVTLLAHLLASDELYNRATGP